METYKDSIPENTGEIVVYQPDEITRLEVRLKDETAWLNRQQIAQLFGRDVKTIGKHINNALKEELSDMAVVAKFATTATDGKTYIVEYYNLEMILSIGYRVKSQRGIIFRRWTNSILKEHLLRGYSLNTRFASVEKQLKKHELILYEHTKKIDFFIQSSLPPKQGIFFDGRTFPVKVRQTPIMAVRVSHGFPAFPRSSFHFPICILPESVAERSE